MDGKSVHTDPTKVEKILCLKQPRNPKEIQKAVGLLGYYQMSVPHFSIIADPLFQLVRKGVPFHWTVAQENAFKLLKEMTTQPPVLLRPDANLPFRLYTDASIIGIDVVLTQLHKDGEHPTLFYSRRLRRAEENYSSWEKETLALVDATKRFRKYLLGTLFVAFTDCNAVRYLLNKKEPTQRLQRWILLLAEFDFELKHIKGKENIVADYLSRHVEEQEEEKELMIVQVNRTEDWDYEKELTEVINAFVHLEFPPNMNSLERKRFWRK